MKNPNLRHITCGKVAMENRNGRELIGYVFDEVGDSLTIWIERSDAIINLSRPIQIDGNYQYIPVGQADYRIKCTLLKPKEIVNIILKLYEKS